MDDYTYWVGLFGLVCVLLVGPLLLLRHRLRASVRSYKYDVD